MIVRKSLGEATFLYFFCNGFDYTRVQFFFLVVVDSYQKDVTCVLFYLAHIFLALYLIDGGIYILFVFEFENDGWFVNILAWNKNEVCKALACSELTMNDVVILGIDVCYSQDTGK